MRQWIRIVSPSEATFVINFHKEICLQQDKQNWAGTGSNQFKTDFWVVLLDILLNDRGSLFQSKNVCFDCIGEIVKTLQS